MKKLFYDLREFLHRNTAAPKLELYMEVAKNAKRKGVMAKKDHVTLCSMSVQKGRCNFSFLQKSSRGDNTFKVFWKRKSSGGNSESGTFIRSAQILSLCASHTKYNERISFSSIICAGQQITNLIQSRSQLNQSQSDGNSHFIYPVSLLLDKISHDVKGWQVYRRWGGLLLGNKVKYCLYQYVI